MSSALGFNGSERTTTTTNRSINAQDSYVASEGSILANNAWVVGDNGKLTITDGGAFDLVGKVVQDAAKLIESLYNKTVSSLSASTNDILSANAVQNQEAAIKAQESTNSLIKTAIIAAAAVGGIYILGKYV